MLEKSDNTSLRGMGPGRAFQSYPKMGKECSRFCLSCEIYVPREGNVDDVKEIGDKPTGTCLDKKINKKKNLKNVETIGRVF